MNSDKLLELAATLQKAIDELNAMVTPKPAPYSPKKGDRVEVIRISKADVEICLGDRGTVMEDSIAPWVRMDRSDARLDADVTSLGIEVGRAWCFMNEDVRPLTPEEIAAENEAENEAKRPKVGDWVRHTDGSIGGVGIAGNDFCCVFSMGRLLDGVPTDTLTVIPKP